MKRRSFLSRYRLGFDLWGAVLSGLLFLPNLVNWCIPRKHDMLNFTTALDGFGVVFFLITLLLLMFFVEKEREKFTFSSPSAAFAGIFLLLGYIAWIFFFCAYLNWGVVIFLAVCPGVSLALFSVCRKNPFAFVSAVVFTALHLAAVCVWYF